MRTVQVRLTEDEGRALREIAERTGKSEDQLLREAVQCFLVSAERRDMSPAASPAEQSDWRAKLRAAQGMWKDRDDLPPLEELRAELDRRVRNLHDDS